VFRYGVATLRCEHDPCAPLQGALIAPKAKHYAAITDPEELGGLLRAIDRYEGNYTTKFALQFAPHVFVRPGELRHAEWDEFDIAAAVWRIPAGKMKSRRPHAVPLSRQVLALLEQIRSINGGSRYVFRSLQARNRPMSENTINAALRRMGYSGDEMTAHGLRATASTLLNESDSGATTPSSGHLHTRITTPCAVSTIGGSIGRSGCAWHSGGVTTWTCCAWKPE
jgi:integrase